MAFVHTYVRTYVCMYVPTYLSMYLCTYGPTRSYIRTLVTRPSCIFEISNCTVTASLHERHGTCKSVCDGRMCGDVNRQARMRADVKPHRREATRRVHHATASMPESQRHTAPAE